MTHKEILEIEVILTKLVGPQLAKVVTELVVTLVNGLLGHVPLRILLKNVVQLLVNLLKSHGLLAKLLSSGNPKTSSGSATCSNGKLKNLTPADQERLIAILSRVLGPYTPRTVVQLVGTLFNGLLCGLPLRQLLHGVVGLLDNLLGRNGLIGGLVSPHGLLGGLLGGSHQPKINGPKPVLDHDSQVHSRLDDFVL